MASKIEDYALIGDCQTAALINRQGSLDWLCFPRFDSPACFAALVGDRENGRWQICPSVPVRQVRRHYWEGTLILETEFQTDSGRVALIDCMPPRTDAPDVVRIIEGREGTVPMHMDLVIRFDYGSIIPWVRRIEGGLRATAGPDTLFCHTPLPVRGENMHSVADFEVHAGQRIANHLVWVPTHSAKPPEKAPEGSLAEAAAWWREWSARCTYQESLRDQVMQSFIVLKAMTYAPTGGLVASPTTSLPELLGGVRNWDYRYCWLRDATFTLYALMSGGYVDEARAWRNWLVNAVAGTPGELQIMYGIAGERRLTELELDWLSGYENSRPVRIGNAASDQHQLDVYGEVMDAMHLARRAGLEPDENAWRIETALLKFLETDWRNPDDGIWEVRGPQRDFTHSKVMAWVALDRGVRAVKDFGLPGDAAKWAKIRDDIHREVCTRGYDPQLKSFVQYFGGRHVDASLLMLPLVGFLPAEDPRMQSTVRRIQKELMHDGFVYRYPTDSNVDGLPEGEGAFLLCTFWLADNLALQKRFAEAHEIFDRLLAIRNDVGLLSEEYDVANRRLVGNFPQAFSHLGLINTAVNLSRIRGPAEDRQRRE